LSPARADSPPGVGRASANTNTPPRPPPPPPPRQPKSPAAGRRRAGPAAVANTRSPPGNTGVRPVPNRRCRTGSARHGGLGMNLKRAGRGVAVLAAAGWGGLGTRGGTAAPRPVAWAPPSSPPPGARGGVVGVAPASP